MLSLVLKFAMCLSFTNNSEGVCCYNILDDHKFKGAFRSSLRKLLLMKINGKRETEFLVNKNSLNL